MEGRRSLISSDKKDASKRGLSDVAVEGRRTRQRRGTTNFNKNAQKKEKENITFDRPVELDSLNINYKKKVNPLPKGDSIFKAQSTNPCDKGILTEKLDNIINLEEDIEKIAREAQEQQPAIEDEVEKDYQQSREIATTGLLDEEDRLQSTSGMFVLWGLQNANKALQLAKSQKEATIDFWRDMHSNTLLAAAENYFMKIYEIGQCLVISSAEDERLFSRLKFVKDKFRNRLDENLEVALRLLVTDFSPETFPFDKALQLWIDSCERRGVLDAEIYDKDAGNGRRRRLDMPDAHISRSVLEVDTMPYRLPLVLDD